jgi:hypothetical protein
LRGLNAGKGIHLPAPSPNPEVIAAVIRLTRGNIRLLVRLRTQMERVLAIKGLATLSVDVVERPERTWSPGNPDEAARISLCVPNN